jgi:hypothetical protein
MHKGAILDVHIVRSLRIAIHSAGLEACGPHSTRRLPAGSDEHRDPAVTLALIGFLDIVRTIWPSACCGGQWSPRVILVSSLALVRAFSPVVRSRARTNTADRSVDCSAGRLLVR